MKEQHPSESQHSLPVDREAILQQIREQSKPYLQRLDAETQAHIKKEQEEARQRPRPRSEQARLADLLDREQTE